VAIPDFFLFSKNLLRDAGFFFAGRIFPPPNIAKVRPLSRFIATSHPFFQAKSSCLLSRTASSLFLDQTAAMDFSLHLSSRDSFANSIVGPRASPPFQSAFFKPLPWYSQSLQKVNPSLGFLCSRKDASSALPLSSVNFLHLRGLPFLITLSWPIPSCSPTIVPMVFDEACAHHVNIPSPQAA